MLSLISLLFSYFFFQHSSAQHEGVLRKMLLIVVFTSSEMKWQLSKRQINRLRGKCKVEEEKEKAVFDKNSLWTRKLSFCRAALRLDSSLHFHVESVKYFVNNCYNKGHLCISCFSMKKNYCQSLCFG